MLRRHLRLALALALLSGLPACGGTVAGGPSDGAVSETASSDAAADAVDGGDVGAQTDGATPTSCGGKTGATCPASQWCSFPEGTCTHPDQVGTCRDRVALPCVAPMPGDEVCGCDGTTYQSACVATSAGMSIDHAGSCDTSTAKICGGFTGAACDATEYCDWGALPNDCGAADGTGICRKRPTACVPSDGIYCGCDGKVYESPCAAGLAGQGVRKNGPC